MEPKFVIWQATLWDKFAKISPLVILASVAIFYYLGHRDWRLIIDVGSVIFVTIAVTWWFWVVYTIGIIATVLNNSNKKLIDVLDEIKEAQEEVYELRPRNRKRREQN